MNHREPPHAPARIGRAGLAPALSILLVMMPFGVHAQPRRPLLGAFVGRTAEPIPYLVAAGAPPLRFAAPPLPPEPAPSAAPAVTAASATSEQASGKKPDILSPEMTETVAPAKPSPTLPASATNETPSNENPENATAPGKSVPPILPDDVRPAVRPEDFLPYFQVPGSARRPATLNVAVPVPPTPPAPAPLPPSSATYTQTPK